MADPAHRAPVAVIGGTASRAAAPVAAVVLDRCGTIHGLDDAARLLFRRPVPAVRRRARRA